MEYDNMLRNIVIKPATLTVASPIKGHEAHTTPSVQTMMEIMME
jgi:hypothetical protein